MSKAVAQSLKGFRDFLPEDMCVLNYIFEVWKSACISYGFSEYNGPVLEYASIYNKSGDEIGTSGKELYKFVDSGGREVALRPEMTPSVARIVASNVNNYPKPIKWFSIAQFFRAEKPQKGRGREFFQLNADIFGESSIASDAEIINLAFSIMTRFGATRDMFNLRLNNRKFANDFFQNVLGLSKSEDRVKLLKVIDKSPKSSQSWLESALREIRNDPGFVKNVNKYLNLKFEDLESFVDVSDGAKELKELFDLLQINGVIDYCVFDPTMARGFDYYTGMVFEVFDKNLENTRSMFGGGRYDNLLSMFGSDTQAVGVAPGDMTTRLFLEYWNLLPKFDTSNTKVLVSVFGPDLLAKSWEIGSALRSQDVATEVYLGDADLSKQLKYASKKSIPFVVIAGPDEVKDSKVVLKNMVSGEQRKVAISELPALCK